jgi:hypothetical protein
MGNKLYFDFIRDSKHKMLENPHRKWWKMIREWAEADFERPEMAIVEAIVEQEIKRRMYIKKIIWELNNKSIKAQNLQYINQKWFANLLNSHVLMPKSNQRLVIRRLLSEMPKFKHPCSSLSKPVISWNKSQTTSHDLLIRK